MDESNESQIDTGKAPLIDRSEQKAALLAKWEADEKANPREPSEEQRAAADDPDVGTPENPQTEEQADAAALEGEPAKVVPPAEDPAAKRGLAAVEQQEKRFREQVAQQRLEFQQIHMGLRQKEAEIQQREKQIQERDARAMRDPVSFFRSLGWKGSMREIAEQFFLAEVGADAPPELQAKRHTFELAQEQRRMAEEMQAMRDGWAREKQEIEYARKREQYRAGLTSTLPRLPDKFGYVKTLAARDPARAVDLLFQEAVAFAQQHPHEDAPTAEYLADIVEQKFSPSYGTAPKTTTPSAGEKRTAPPVNPNHTGRAPLRPQPKTREELREDVLRRMEAGDID